MHEPASPHLRIALRALRVNKLRSALTMLGIIIGVAAVITMIAVGDGAQARVEEQIKSLGSNIIIVLPAPPPRAASAWAPARATLTEDDAYAITREVAEMQAAAPADPRQRPDRGGNSNWSTALYGATPEYLKRATGRSSQAAASSRPE